MSVHWLTLLTILTTGFLNPSATAIIFGHDVINSNNGPAASIVALQMSEIQSDGRLHYYKGSGFLVARDIVLTAGHNVAYIPDAENIQAIFAPTPCWGQNSCGERRITAKRVVVHPEFAQTGEGTDNDLAVLQLSQHAPEGSIPLRLIDRPISDLSSLQIFGYGTDRESSGIPLSAFRLRTIRLPISNYQVGSGKKFWLDQSRGGICAGDSGGPAISDRSDIPLATGIAVHVTYNNGIASCLTRGAFMDLLFFKPWLDKVLETLH